MVLNQFWNQCALHTIDATATDAKVKNPYLNNTFWK